MHVYEDVKKMLCDELKEITKKGELSAGSLDTIDKLLHSLNHLELYDLMFQRNYQKRLNKN